MTEAEWNSSDNPVAMLTWWRDRQATTERPIFPSKNDRKLRLFAVAVCRQSEQRAAGQEALLDVAERFADRLITDGERQAAWVAFFQDTCGNTIPNDFRWGLLRAADREASWIASGDTVWGKGLPVAALLRDIIGNPHSPVALPKTRRVEVDAWDGGPAGYRMECPWLTPTVVSLAEKAYAGDWTALGPLSDALEEAGCEGDEVIEETQEYALCAGCNGHGTDLSTGRYPEDCQPCFACGGTGDSYRTVRKVTRPTHPLLEHLRSPGPHVKGCWAIDLLLGRD